MASMGPRSHERGNTWADMLELAKGDASMGPRSHERGNEGPWISSLRTTALQWGRVLMNAETR